MSIFDLLVTPLSIIKEGKSRDLFDIKCAQCDKIHKYPKNQILAKIKHNQLRFCCQKCQIEYLRKNSNSQIVSCAHCQKELRKTNRELKRSLSGNTFCSQNCAAKSNNKNRKYNNELKSKISNGLKKYNLENPRPKKVKICAVCNKNFLGKRKTCSKECYKILNIESGRRGGSANAASPFTKRSRSKNEQLFYEKIKSVFPDAKHNPKIFNGYDADIVIHELKLAIHWNGLWHYKQIFSEEHFNSILFKDQERYKNIESAGYTNYIIKDMGKFKESKVESEFIQFLIYLQD